MIHNPRGNLFRLIKCTKGKSKGLVKHFINIRAESGSNKATALLQKPYANTCTYLSISRKMFHSKKCFIFSSNTRHIKPLNNKNKIINKTLARLPIHSSIGGIKISSCPHKGDK